jgi:hypothetical protein
MAPRNHPVPRLLKQSASTDAKIAEMLRRVEQRMSSTRPERGPPPSSMPGRYPRLEIRPVQPMKPPGMPRPRPQRPRIHDHCEGSVERKDAHGPLRAFNRHTAGSNSHQSRCMSRQLLISTTWSDFLRLRTPTARDATPATCVRRCSCLRRRSPTRRARRVPRSTPPARP